jgi:phage gp46-like protein
MSVILLGWSDEGGDLQLDADNRIVMGHPLVTELLTSLNIDRAPDPGDPVPEGIERFGNWQRSFDPDAIQGSKLWMLRYVRPVERALAFAPIWATEATRWMVSAKRVVSIEHTADRIGFVSIRLTHTIQVDAATRRRFLTEVPYVVV